MRIAILVNPTKKIGKVRRFNVVLVLIFFRVIAIMDGLLINPDIMIGVANTRKIIFSIVDNMVAAHSD